MSLTLVSIFCPLSRIGRKAKWSLRLAKKRIKFIKRSLRRQGRRTRESLRGIVARVRLSRQNVDINLRKINRSRIDSLQQARLFNVHKGRQISIVNPFSFIRKGFGMFLRHTRRNDSLCMVTVRNWLIKVATMTVRTTAKMHVVRAIRGSEPCRPKPVGTRSPGSLTILGKRTRISRDKSGRLTLVSII